MNQELVSQVFSVVQALEKCLSQSKSMFTEQKRLQPKTVDLSLNEQARILDHMRKVANKLQLELAASDNLSAMRSLQIFQGLTSLVRPEVLETFQALAKGKVCLKLEDGSTTYH
ncbi:hypothetical protein JNK13_07705 [bacterium]|nr:hypothetical protein [bacterium]